MMNAEDNKQQHLNPEDTSQDTGSVAIAETGRDERLAFLAAGKSRRTVAGNSIRYSRFVKGMKLLLPLAALAIIWLVVSWPGIKDRFTPVIDDSMMPASIGRNELLRPRYQSVDDKQQPFNITAHRAIQSSHDPSVVILERPMADMVLNNGSWLAAEAKKGAYRQKEERLLLEDDVRLYHDNGYQLETDKLLVNIAKREAWSDVAVHGQGPAGVLDASGMKAGIENGKIIFTGPVRLLLNRSIRGLH